MKLASFNLSQMKQVKHNGWQGRVEEEQYTVERWRVKIKEPISSTWLYEEIEILLQFGLTRKFNISYHPWAASKIC